MLKLTKLTINWQTILEIIILNSGLIGTFTLVKLEEHIEIGRNIDKIYLYIIFFYIKINIRLNST